MNRKKLRIRAKEQNIFYCGVKSIIFFMQAAGITTAMIMPKEPPTNPKIAVISWNKMATTQVNPIIT
jgi:hypothetical protein